MKLSAGLTTGLLLPLILTACSQDKFSADSFTSRRLSVEVANDEQPASGDQAAAPGSADAAPNKKTDDPEADDIIEVAGGAPDGGEGPAPGEEPTGKDKTKENAKGNSKKSADDISDAGACGGSVKSNRIKVSGSLNKVTVDSKTAYALKVTGNQNEVTMDVSGQSPGLGMPGVCIFVAGNKNKVIIDVGVKVGGIFVKARGNQALIEVRVAKDASVGNLQLDFNGNSPKMVLSGEGTYPCTGTSLKGKDADVSCNK